MPPWDTSGVLEKVEKVKPFKNDNIMSFLTISAQFLSLWTLVYDLV